MAFDPVQATDVTLFGRSSQPSPKHVFLLGVHSRFLFCAYRLTLPLSLTIRPGEQSCRCQWGAFADQISSTAAFCFRHGSWGRSGLDAT